MTITEKLSHLRAINIGTLFDDILRENKGDILDMNRSQMYDKGIMDVVTEKKERYSPATIRAKKKAPFNKTEFVTLKWMGNFHRELKLIILKDTFLISSDNEIWGNYLEPNKRFSQALGLTETNKGELRNVMRDEIVKKLRNII